LLLLLLLLLLPVTAAAAPAVGQQLQREPRLIDGGCCRGCTAECGKQNVQNVSTPLAAVMLHLWYQKTIFTGRLSRHS
jgi:hypothetical protein